MDGGHILLHKPKVLVSTAGDAQNTHTNILKAAGLVSGKHHRQPVGPGRPCQGAVPLHHHPAPLRVGGRQDGQLLRDRQGLRAERRQLPGAVGSDRLLRAPHPGLGRGRLLRQGRNHQEKPGQFAARVSELGPTTLRASRFRATSTPTRSPGGGRTLATRTSTTSSSSPICLLERPMDAQFTSPRRPSSTRAALATASQMII